ncbi:MAG: PAS domain S-box protein [bacterium]|nr:PAS domain S-box protein [bacterium]
MSKHDTGHISMRDNMRYGLGLTLAVMTVVLTAAGAGAWAVGCAFISALYTYLSYQMMRHEKITALVKERKLQEDTQMADDIIAAIPSGLVGLDRDGHVCRWNDGATRILGMGRGGIVGRMVDQWPINGQESIVALLKEALMGKTVKRGSLVVQRSDGKSIPLGISTSRLGGDGAGGTGAVAVFQDLTDVRKIQDEMKKQERLAAIGTLSASIAHEIRNPLASIAGSVEMLSADLDVSGENKELLDLIIKESDRLNELITSFLEFTRDREPEFVTVSPVSVVKEVIREVEIRTEAGPDLTLEFEEGDISERIIADPKMLKQVILNLILNACQAMSWLGTIRVSLQGDEKDGMADIRIVCKDNGPGVPETARARIFEPFFSTKKEGTGLGLPIAHRIAELHNGNLELVTDEDPGATFLFSIKTHIAAGIQGDTDTVRTELSEIA